MPSASLVHPHALVEPGARLGPGTRVSAFTHIAAGADIGADCLIGDHVFIDQEVTIGSRVTVQNGVQVGRGVTLEEGVYVGPNVTFTDATFPRPEPATAATLVQQGAVIGANTTILAGVHIGTGARVGAGSVITQNIPPNAIVAGNPARIEGYVSTVTRKPLVSHAAGEADALLCVTEARLIRLPLITDLRGSLSFGEYSQHLPFSPRRYFVIFGVPSTEARGEHAHKEQHQFLICLKGSCAVVVDNGRDREEVLLNQPNVGLYIPPMLWATQYKYTPEAILLVLASDVYEAGDYIRNYDQYLQLVNPK